MILTFINLLSSMVIPVDLRFLVILTLFLSVAAFVMGAFSVYLFFKFYRDTIKPLPVLIHGVTGNNISLRLLNSGNSPFFISKFFVSKDNRVSGSIADFLPLVDENTGYISLSIIREGMKVMPEQSVKIFEFDLTWLDAGLDLDKIREIISHLDGLSFELHCRDIGKRYTTMIRKSISLDQLKWETSKS
jgi:hypothetical protein